jgi:hypothetical protein
MHSLKSSDMSRQSSGIRERVGWGRGQGGRDFPRMGASADGEGEWRAYLGRMKLVARAFGGVWRQLRGRGRRRRGSVRGPGADNSGTVGAFALISVLDPDPKLPWRSIAVPFRCAKLTASFAFFLLCPSVPGSYQTSPAPSRRETRICFPFREKPSRVSRLFFIDFFRATHPQSHDSSRCFFLSGRCERLDEESRALM